MHYIGIVHKDPGSDYGISFPDLPGCFSAAGTLDELVDMAAEAVALHLEGTAADGQAQPTPSSLEAVRAHEDAPGAMTFLPVRAPDSSRCIRVNISLPETLVQQIDAVVGTRRRSGFLAAAAREKLLAR